MKGKFSIAAAILASRSPRAADAFSHPSRRVPRSSALWSAADDRFSTSLVADTLDAMGTDVERIELDERIARIGSEGMTREERARRRRALVELGVPDFMGFVSGHDDGDDEDDGPVRDGRLRRSSPSVLQLNIGLYCNQACNHCHVESSPLRTSETMSSDVAARCLALLRNSPESVDTLDLTGGAPELNGQFRLLVSMARAWSNESGRELTIIDRCNLTALLEPGQTDLIDFLRDNRVTVVASLPCYGEDNVDAQRGRGVFQRSIEALSRLNDAGYGSADRPDLRLDLVYNPSGPFLPPSQSSLEVDYKRELMEKFGIRFNNLLTITNMPIKRFADYLAREKKMKEYMELLVNNYNHRTVGGLMCLNTVSVGWDGRLYDCDFNQQLGMGIMGEGRSEGEGVDDAEEGGERTKMQRRKLSVFDIDSLADLDEYSVMTDNHCFGCTAGSGISSSAKLNTMMAGITKEEAAKRISIGLKDVLRMSKPTKGFLCSLSSNVYNIEFVKFAIRDDASKHVFFEMGNGLSTFVRGTLLGAARTAGKEGRKKLFSNLNLLSYEYFFPKPRTKTNPVPFPEFPRVCSVEVCKALPMTTPSKFDMGGMPKTKTGLVPTSFRRKMEDLSKTTNWRQLPPKPKPPMYPYRGDYVNERNRKLQREKKKLSQKSNQRSFEYSKSRESDGSGRTQSANSSSGNTSSTPSLSIVGEGIPPYNSSKNWDSYCKHISFHKLSDDEQLARARNKNEFVSYLRSSAAKRHDMKSSNDKEAKQMVAETIVRQRKPPVPRLSRLARSGENKENLQNGTFTPKGDLFPSLRSRDATMPKARENSTKSGYLDFISKKVDGSRKLLLESKETTVARITPNFGVDEDDDSKFRSQIQRIVERAAEMVLKEQHSDFISLGKGVVTNTNKTSTKASRVELCTAEKTASDLRRKAQIERNRHLFDAAKNNDFFRRQNDQLSILEEQVKSMSSSVVSSETDLFSSSLSRTTGVSSIDIMSRVQPRPMTNLLHDIDSDSCDTCHLTESASASIDVSAAAISCSIGQSSVEKSMSVKIQPNTIERHPSFDTCPEEILPPPPVNPSIEPSRVSREEEPLPRGYEHTLQKTHVYPMGEARSQHETPESLIDDLFSLFS